MLIKPALSLSFQLNRSIVLNTVQSWNVTLEYVPNLRTGCRKDRLRVYKIEKKIDFLKICQNKGLGKLVHKIYLSDRLEVKFVFGEFFLFCPCRTAKSTPKSALL